MKKNIFAVTAFVTVTAMVFTICVDTEAKVRMSRKKLTMEVSKTHTLKIKGVKGKKIIWKSSKPGVAKVNKKGKVTALRKGKATITAKAGKKLYKCVVTVKDKRNKGGLNMATPGPDEPAVIQDNPAATAGQFAAGSQEPTPASSESTPVPTPDNSGSGNTYPCVTEYAALMDCRISYIDEEGFDISDADGEVIRDFFWPEDNKDIVYDGILTGAGEEPFNSSNHFLWYAASGENMNCSDIRIGDIVDVVYGYTASQIEIPLENRPCFCAAINVHKRQGSPKPEPTPDNSGSEITYPSDTEYAALMDCHISYIDRKGWFEISDADGEVIRGFYWPKEKDIVYNGILTGGGEVPFNSSNKFYSYNAIGENMNCSDIRIGDMVDVVYGYYYKDADIPLKKRSCICVAINVHDRQGLQLPNNFSDELCGPCVMEYAAYMDCRISDIEGGMIELSDTDGKVICRFGGSGWVAAMPKYFLCDQLEVVYDGILTDGSGKPFNSSNKLGTYEAKGENMDYSDIRIGDIVDVVYGYSLEHPQVEKRKYECYAINVHKR